MMPSYVVLLVLLFSAMGSAYGRVLPAEPLSTDLPKPYDTVLQAVRDVATSDVIHGTSQYQGTNELSGANIESMSSAFRRWKGPGVVLYKVRRGALAPAHFIESNDMGTVAVRYVVQKISRETTRLRIEAAFVEDTHHHQHPSDGAVEIAEFAAVNARLKAFDEETKQTAEVLARHQQERKVRDLQAALAQERERLDAATAEVQQLQERARELREKLGARVKTPNAELKSQPFTRARTLELLAREQTVTILTWTPYWCRVRLPSGEEGWIYHLFLEAVQ